MDGGRVIGLIDEAAGTAGKRVTDVPDDLLAALHRAVGADAVRTRATDRLGMAHDASHFLLTPAAVATPADAADVGRLFAACAAVGVPLTFRSGGTSLSGQSVTDGVLADTRRHFRTVEVLDGGQRVRVGPGATVRQVNQRLVGLGRKLGPDPASESACTIGGVVADNSSGMACGTEQNSYRTVESMVIVLPSGTVLDTAAVDADARLFALEPELATGLGRLRDRVRADPASVALIRRQFAMKNTMGYGVNALLDHDSPAEILAHLMIGSEGTLGFVASVVFRTVPLLATAVTGLLVFDDLSRATGALPALVATGPATIELMDAVSLRVGQLDPQADPVLQRISVDRHAALLVEYQAATLESAQQQVAEAGAVLRALPLTNPVEMTADPRARAGLWHIRKGLYATVAGARPSGTTAMLEDIVVPVPALLETCERLTGLFDRHGYADSVIFGHAKDGNIHFMLNEELGGGETLGRFAAFTEDMVDLVLGLGGSLKAEHGTGRVMAPYVRRQYGDELYEVMREIKRLCDPRGVLNPGVIITDDADEHLKNLKTSPTVEAEVDRCVECGYCEPVCPSRDLTTTPRQRIVLRRELARARAAGDGALVAELERDYDYDAVDTCAVDGMCQTACPVLINTGDLMKRLRAEDAGRIAAAGWKTAAKHWSATTSLAAAALTVTAALPNPVVRVPNLLLRKVSDPDVLPLWSPELPAGGSRRPRPDRARGSRPSRDRDTVDAVYFAACVSTMFGPATGTGVRSAFETLCERAGLVLRYPDDLPNLCCGTPWKSKGMTGGYEAMSRLVLPALRRASHDGEIPIVCDASSCTEGLRQMLENSSGGGPLMFVDSVAFVAAEVLPLLEIPSPLDTLALHPTCSSTRMGLNQDLMTVAGAVASTVTVPVDWGCCGFAGDRGLLHPELTASATAAQGAEIAAGEFDGYASCNRTCELGMTRATGHPYEHVLELLERVSR